MLVPEVIIEANRIRTIKANRLSELVKYLNHTDDAAYAGWIEWIDLDFPLALKYKKILDKIWDIRTRIGKSILKGEL